MKKLLFIGPINKGNTPYTGDSAKNQFFEKRFREVFSKVSLVDTWAWKRRPWVLIELLFKLAFCRNYKIVVSANAGSADKIIKLAKIFGHTPRIFYWVIGGSLPEMLKKKIFDWRTYSNIGGIFVEGTKMVESMQGLGLTNVRCVPNFKDICYVSQKDKCIDSKLHFVFISRIVKAKGCDYILEAVEKLNAKGLSDKFDVTFFGKTTENQEWLDSFTNKVNLINNVVFKGLLDLRQPKNYGVLSRYDVMLFPTYWGGEGFPGVIIDAYMSGLPVIATDWNLNTDLIIEGKTGWIIPVHDVDALVDKMEYVMNSQSEVKQFSLNCSVQALEYDFRNVLSEDNLKALKVLD